MARDRVRGARNGAVVGGTVTGAGLGGAGYAGHKLFGRPATLGRPKARGAMDDAKGAFRALHKPAAGAILAGGTVVGAATGAAIGRKKKEPVAKMKTKTSYCKQHGKFDTCAEVVEKALGPRTKRNLKRAAVVGGTVAGAVAGAHAGGAVGHLAAATGKGMMGAEAGGLVTGATVGGGVTHKLSKALLPKAAPEVGARLDRLAARHKGGFGFKTRTPQDAMPVGQKVATVPKQRVGKRHGPGGGNVGDDGIHHLEGVQRVRTSPETRTGGLKPLLEVGRRKLDGTPKTGRGDDSVSSRVSEAHKMGRSGRSKAVGSSKIREQIGKAAGDPFEVEKAFGHTLSELKEIGGEEKKRFKDGNPRRIINRQYGREIRADVKGAQGAAFKAGVADTVRHPIATHGLNVNSGYRIAGVRRKAALAAKEKEGFKTSVAKAMNPHTIFLGD